MDFAGIDSLVFGRVCMREPRSRKYDYGHLLIIGGSSHYTGAPALAARAAWLSGVDMVTVAAPARAADAASHFSPDMVARPLAGEYLSQEHVDELCALAKRKVSAVLIGNGLGREEGTLAAVAALRSRMPDIPFIIDADALLAADRMTLKESDILMPNVHEFSKLSGLRSMPDDNAVPFLARSLGAIVMSKGHEDIISDGSRTAIVRGGRETVFLAKGGTGDVLAGVCASLVAQGVPAFESAVFSARAVKRAGELLGAERGPFYTPSHLFEPLSRVLSEFWTHRNIYK